MAPAGSDRPPWAPALSRRVALAFDVASAAVLGAMLLLVVTTFRDYAITWDESWHLTYGDHILSWFLTAGTDTSALCYRIDYMYGGGFDLLGAVARRLSPLSDYETIHLTGALVGVLGLWGTCSLGRRLGGPVAGFAALVLLSTTSVYYGHMFNNPKDLPFAVGYVWAVDALCAIVLAIPRVPRAAWVRFAVFAGLAMGVRIAGILLLVYLGAAVLVLAWLRARNTRSLDAGLRSLRRLAVPATGAIVGAWVVMLSTWPWALLDPLRRPWLALGRMSRFTVHDRVMPFAGEMMRTTEPRWDYLAHYFALKLPLSVLLLVAAAAGLALWTLLRRSRRQRLTIDKRNAALILAAAIMAPPSYAIVVRSVLYDGLRHFLFLVPLFAAVAGLMVVVLPQLVRRRRAKTPVAVVLSLVLGGLVARQVHTMRVLHPFQYIYFNELVGGVPGAYGNYDTDYYGNSYKEGFTTLAQYLWRTEPERFLQTRYKIGGCIPDFIARDYMEGNFVWVKRGTKGAEFYLGYTRANCHERQNKWPELMRVERMDTLLLVIRDRRAAPDVDHSDDPDWPPPDSGTKPRIGPASSRSAGGRVNIAPRKDTQKP